MSIHSIIISVILYLIWSRYTFKSKLDALLIACRSEVALFFLNVVASFCSQVCKVGTANPVGAKERTQYLLKTY